MRRLRFFALCTALALAALAAVEGLGVSPVHAQTIPAETVTAQREAAVRQARAGQRADAVAKLRALLAAGQEDGFVALDLATLLQQDVESEYTDIEQVQREMQEARRLYTRRRWPTIDVTRRSIEETAATIMQMLNARRGTEANQA